MSDLATVAQRKTPRKTAWKLLEWFGHKQLFWIVLLAAAIIYMQPQFWERPTGGDRANWDYMAQTIVRGGVPYRDVVNIKSPLSAYIGAAAIIVTRPFGIRDVLALRIAFIFLAALTVAFTFQITLDYFGDLRMALLAATIMLTFNAFAGLHRGVQPKTPMILFGMLALRAILKDRPFKAGALGMLSALSWQPGLLFVGAAGLAFSRYLTSWRDMKVVKLIAGAAIPLAIMLGYFWAAGALRDFYIWNIHFNATVYGPGEAQSVANFFEHFSVILHDSYFDSRIYFYLAIGGVSVALWKEISNGIKLGGSYLLQSAPRHAIIIAPIVYFAFCMIDIQGSPDLIPLVPFVSVFAAVAIVFVIKREANLILRAWTRGNRAAIENWTSAVMIALIFFFNVSDALTIERGFSTLKEQELEVASIVAQLEPGDKIFVHGRTEVLTLSGLTNASKYFLLDRGKDHYLDRTEPGGFDGWLARMKAERPKIVLLYRPAKVHRMKDLEDWVAQDYEMRVGRIFTYWIRKESNN